LLSSELLQSTSQRESCLLAPYAMHSSDSRGRKHFDAGHLYRGPYERDRDRILHSSAYRRLSGKMQVFTGERGDYHRTRLTHTQEVATIARTMGRCLRLNEDLIEALALVHDIGHPPYGHAGEDILHECMLPVGGFSHNQFALTIVEELERPYPKFPGLNLSLEVLEGQTKRVNKRAGSVAPLLEVQIVDAADSMTYDAHDVDDALKLGLVTFDELKENSLIQRCIEQVQQSDVDLQGWLLNKAIVRRLIDLQVSDLLEVTATRLVDAKFASAEALRQSNFYLTPSPELGEQKKELERFLYNRVYRHAELVRVRSEAQHRMQRMYEGYCRRPELLPEKYQVRANQIGIEKMAGQYIAGMTDRFFDSCYQLHFSAHLMG
jgi:dGTPase